MEQSKNPLFSGALIAMIGVVIGAMAVSNGAATSAYNGANIDASRWGQVNPRSLGERPVRLRSTDPKTDLHSIGQQRTDGVEFREARLQPAESYETMHGAADIRIEDFGPDVVEAFLDRCAKKYGFDGPRAAACRGKAFKGIMHKDDI